MRDNHYEIYLKTSAPGRIVRLWREEWFDDPEIEVIEGEVDETSAFENCLTRRCS